MKKVTSLVLGLALVLSLAACGNKKAEEKEAVSNELTIWCWDPAFNIYAMEEAGKIYNENHKDKPVKINVVETPWPDLQAKITAIGTSGQYDQLPDIFLMQDNAFKKNFQFYPEVFANLTDSGINFSSFAKAKVDYSVIDGKNYGIPFDNGTAVNALREDFLKEAGFTVNDLQNITWERYREIGRVVKEKTAKPMFSFVAADPAIVFMILQSCGSSLFNKDGSVNIKDNQVLKDTMILCKKLVEDGIVQTANNWDEYIGSFTNGNVVSTINGCWILASIQTSEDQKGKWGIANLPRLYPGKESSANYSTFGGSSWAITKDSRHKALAIDFMKETFAGSVEFYNRILPSSGAIATFLPAKGAEAYREPQEFFAGQKIYEDILTYSDKVPSARNSVYYYEGNEAVGKAFVSFLQGEDLDKVLDAASEEVKFKME